MNPLSAKKLRITILALLIVVVAGIAVFLLRPPEPDFLTRPEPNGYELLLAAAEKIQVEKPLNITNELAAFVRQHQEVFEDFENALPHHSEAPARSYNAKTMDLMEAISIRKLSHALIVKAKLAQQENRRTDAANIYLDTIRLGQRLEHGPLFSFMVGSAIELQTLEKFEEVLPQLSASESARLSVQVQRFNNSRIPWDEVLRRERYFMVVNSTNFIESLRYRFSNKFKAVTKSSEERYLNTAAHTEILAATMAALRYSIDEKKMLDRVEALAPKYIPSVPLDPYTRSPLLIASSSTNFVIYSAGPNKQNDQTENDDITLDHKDQTGFRIVARALSDL